MSATGDPLGPDEGGQDLLAAEYVIGVLDAAGRRRAEARLATDEAFAREVEAWEARLAPLAGEVAPQAPPAVVWDRIAAALPPAAVAALPRTPQPTGQGGLWRSLAFWRVAAAGGGAIAAAAVIALAVVLSPGAGPAPLSATLMPKAGKAALMVTIDRDKGMLMVMPAALEIPPSRVPQLWLIGADGKPRSLGLVSADKPMAMKVPADLMGAIGPKVMLALSVEPPGGSPTGLPTGPVVAEGMVTEL